MMIDIWEALNLDKTTATFEEIDAAFWSYEFDASFDVDLPTIHVADLLAAVVARERDEVHA